MTHRDSPHTAPSRGQGDRAVPGIRRPAPTGAQRGGFTESELALIHATAEAHGLAIEICSVVVPDGTFPPTPDGAPRPEVARILAGLRRNTPTAAHTAGFGTLADRRADARTAGQAVAADAVAPDRAVGVTPGVAYDREAYDLEASRRLAVASDDVAGAELTAIAAETMETDRG